MKVIIAFCLLAVAAAVDEPIPILSFENVVEPEGKFHYSFETGNGIKAEEHGELKTFDEDRIVGVVKGRYSFVGDDGQTYSLSYTADENGFVPEGEHLPVAPPVPEPILRALQYIAEHTVKEA